MKWKKWKKNERKEEGCKGRNVKMRWAEIRAADRKEAVYVSGIISFANIEKHTKSLPEGNRFYLSHSVTERAS